MKQDKNFFNSHIIRKMNLRYFALFHFISSMSTNVFIVNHHLIVLRWRLRVYAK